MTAMTARMRFALILAATCFCLPLAAMAQTVQTSKTPEAQQPQTAKPETSTAPAETAVRGLPASVDPNKFDLGAEDVIQVVIWRERDLSGIHVIRPDGKITMPLVGEISAAGLTPTKLQAHIADKLSTLINNPQVTVQVQAVRSKRYYVTGEIFRPGAYPLVVPTTVFEALTLAGGFREFASKKNITVVRGDRRLKFNYNDVVKGKKLEQNILVESGDHIIVP